MPIWRIRDRRTFEDLRARGRRHRSGTVTVTALLVDDGRPPRVAFAISKQVGPAVVRNKVRRRLRAIAAAQSLPSGAYLLSVTPGAAASTFSELQASVAEAVAVVTQ